MTSIGWEQRSAGARVLTILALGVCASLVAGWGHWLETWIAGTVLGGFRWVSRDFGWMAPVSYALVLVPLAGAAALLAVLVRHRLWLALSVCGLALVTGMGLLLPYSQVSRAAALILATGFAVQAGRSAYRAPDRWSTAAGRIAMIGVTAVCLLALVAPRWRAWREHRAVAALPAAAAGAPDVLLIVLDAARAKSLGFVTPGAGTTPRLDQWTRSGVVFEKAFSAAPWTLPSHAAMVSGRRAGELKANWTVPIDAEHDVLPELLLRAGYVTAGFVANLHYTAWDSGLARGFLHWDDYQRDWPQVVHSSSLMQTQLADTLRRLPTLANARQAFSSPDLSILRQHRYRSRLGAEVVDAFLTWEKARDARPWFALLNLMDPHLATSAPDETRRRYPHDERGPGDYEAAMRYDDAQVGRLLDSLEARGTLDRTIVVVTADHGELLGEHGLEGHARSVYRDVLHVPLFMRYPARIPAGSRIPRAVSLRDLAATVQDLVAAAGPRLPGRSLAAAWDDAVWSPSPAIAEARQQPSPLGDYPTATGDLTALFDEEWYYIRNHGTGREELYHFAADTGEVMNHASSADSSRLLKPWRERLVGIQGALRK